MSAKERKFKITDFEKPINYTYDIEDGLVSRIREFANRHGITDIDVISILLPTVLKIAEEIDSGCELILVSPEGVESEIVFFDKPENIDPEE